MSISKTLNSKSIDKIGGKLSGFSGVRVEEWTAYSPELNTIENI